MTRMLRKQDIRDQKCYEKKNCIPEIPYLKMSRKVFILLWKDLLMRKNHYIATTLEVLLPVVLVVLANISLPKEQHEIDNDPILFEAYTEAKCIPRHSHYENIVYEPSTPFTDILMSKAACYAGYRKSSVKSGKLSDEKVYFTIGVKFDAVSENDITVPETLNYTLYPTNKVWANVLKLWRYSESAIPKYTIPTLHNVVELQRGIDISYLYLKNISTTKEVQLVNEKNRSKDLQPPCIIDFMNSGLLVKGCHPWYKQSQNYTKLNLENTDVFDRGPRIFSIATYLSLFVAFSLIVSPIISRIMQEKYTGAKELMLMMGVVRWQLWVAKFMDVILFLIISMSGVVIFLYIPLKEDANTLKIQPFLLWWIIMYGMIGITFFLFFMSCFFERTTLAVFVTQIICFVPFTFKIIISKVVELPAFVTYLMYLLPHISLMQGVSLFLDFDFYGKTVKFTERLSGKEDSLCLLNVLCIMAFSNALYVILTWYLEHIKPGRYGVPQPYNFCFKKSYWMPTKVLTSYSNACSNNFTEGFELVPNSLHIGVSIQNVSKLYKTLDKGIITAVDCISLDFYHGEISALLGHNGAGKTTVFSMITGLAYPTSGKIIINGYDLGVNVTEARRSLGLCPQQDMLFNDLTAEQILKFYGVLKGLTLKDAKAEASHLIKKLKLTDVRSTQAHRLSGGQKRKVSLAIALIAGSEVLVLDEPTSGMDPEVRREIWEILLGFRGARTILLTTHFMEEADALCDRIAVMDHGKIKCYGSPMFLKSKYGKGYVLSVVVLNLDITNDLLDYVKGFVPMAKFKSQNIRTLTFELPETEVNVFPALLSGLEEKQKKNEITSYCISLSTLEDVFLRLRSGHEASDDFDAIDSPAYNKLDIEDLPESKISRCPLFIYQLWSLLVKKWILFQRCYKSFFVYCLIPALLLILRVSLSGNKSHSNEVVDLSSTRSLTYSLGLYAPSLVLYSGLQDGDKETLFAEFVKSFRSDVQEVDAVKDAVYKTFKDDFYTYAKKLNLAVQFSERETNILHNEEAVHMIPVSLNMVHNFFLKLWFKNSSIETSVNVRFANKEPVFTPRSLSSKCNIESLPDISGSQTLFYLLGPIKESFYGAKGLQLMITSTPLYWLSHLIFDIVSFFVYIFLICLGLKFSQSDDFMFEHSGEILLSLVLWGCGLILFAYMISTLIKNVAAAFSVNIIIYVAFIVMYDVISLEGLPKYFQYLHPSCILKFGYNDLCSDKKRHYILALFLYDLVLFTFLILKDSKILGGVFHRLINRVIKVNYFSEVTKDEYVKEEEAAVRKLINKENISVPTLLVNELKRWYFKGCHPSPAVRGISFAVNRGECFGLLGVNGAGKTSTFKMLTGSLPLSHGSTYACSQRLSFFNRQKYLLLIGYCPQAGGLIPKFTGKELLEFFARLRGVRKSYVREDVQKWLEKMNLLEYAKQKCGTYSGGNQRKLSAAVALIGDCPLIFLDEPTSGVDPLSRRAIWNAIGNVQKDGQSVVLTSHSMDECEALCSRLAIMVNGRFRCIGETATLKNRFGQGYCVQLKLSNGASVEAIYSLKKCVLTAFDSACELVDEHLTFIQYYVKNESLGWADLFAKLNVLRENFSILESYTASATTLEQIFIYFARNQ